MEHSGSAKKHVKSTIPISVLISLLCGVGYFYYSLPALNFKSQDFYVLLGFICVVYIACTLILSGFNFAAARHSPKEYLFFIKAHCLPVAVLLLALVAVMFLGSLISAPIFHAKKYQQLLTVETGDFASEVQEVSYGQIPRLDSMSAQRLGDRKLGELDDMVSQFEVSPLYAQINFQDRPVRVTYLEYGDIIKWFNNRGGGLPAYLLVDMVTQDVEVIRLQEGIKYSPGEHFGRNMLRHLRFKFPTYMFATPIFEMDETGHPYWVCPKIEKTIGLFGGTDIRGAVLMDAVTGECTYYEEVPVWVDRVYSAELIIEQYNYHGTLVNGFINSILGQRNVTVTTEGFNYIAMNDDVYMYTGVTSVGGDQSNIGFLLCNQRTKETTYYRCSGATEISAMASARGVVQHLNYQATFPLLLNVAGQPTYFMALKDAAELVKMYAMVNVQQYQIVATGASVVDCERAYITLLAQNNITDEVRPSESSAAGVIDEIRTAVIEGNSYYFLRLVGDDFFYSLSAAENPITVVLNPGDSVTIEYNVGDANSPILGGYFVTLDRKGA